MSDDVIIDETPREIRSTRFSNSDGEIISSDEESPPNRKRKRDERTPSPVILNAFISKGNETDYGDFLIDRSESVAVSSAELSMNSDVPTEESEWMKKVCSELLSPFAKMPEEGEPSSKKRRNGCFNCGGNHSVSACTEPRDQQRIREAQQAHREQSRNFNRLDGLRYHDEEKGGEEFRPGRLSYSLRKALGIGPDDIPEWIYRMRKMGFIEGYPPGYLKQAIVRDTSHKLLSFHSIDGLGDYVPEDDGRDSPPPQIDKTKIIGYFGFNKHYRSLKDRERFHVPPFNEFVDFHQEHQIKKHTEEQHQKRKERERLRNQRETPSKKSNNYDDDDDDILILEPPKPPILDDDDDDVIIIDRNASTLDSGDSAVVTEKAEKADVVQTPKGAIKSVVLRTPIMVRRNAAGEIEKDEIPPLDNFKEGIIPFQVEEETTPHRGFLKKIVAKIKEVTGKK